MFSTTIVLYLFAGWCCFAHLTNSTLPAHLPAVVSVSSNGTCPAGDVIKTGKNTKEHIKHVIKKIVLPNLNDLYGPPCSCGGVGGWTRMAYLNMTDPNQQCPTNWTLHSSPIRGCGRTETSPSCESAFFQSNNRLYSRVCGRVNAYQRGTPDSFGPSIIAPNNILNTVYVDGISLTHGTAGVRWHIWTFAAALYEQDPNYITKWNCKCTNINYNWPYQTPSFVGNNYFCDTGNPGPGFVHATYYSADPLWDGEGCGATSTCCQFNNPPWFCTSLLQPTSDDLELRICLNQPHSDEDIIISLVDIYVK